MFGTISMIHFCEPHTPWPRKRNWLPTTVRSTSTIGNDRRQRAKATFPTRHHVMRIYAQHACFFLHHRTRHSQLPEASERLKRQWLPRVNPSLSNLSNQANNHISVRRDVPTQSRRPHLIHTRWHVSSQSPSICCIPMPWYTRVFALRSGQNIACTLCKYVYSQDHFQRVLV
ncbi:hypothetical protein BCR44DRAFT_208499 [Catenaria anguillulae PL171]|uniref:Uncharacterized protein n=1 Tax=Catenaria anguillulae PL171 TaxID=765915 RepID=A0A1Y2H7V9_9FUNG|nr:hypothetical protein BCR44DRAFT_208499 [Catenaria anguillulae PL171]